MGQEKDNLPIESAGERLAAVDDIVEMLSRDKCLPISISAGQMNKLITFISKGYVVDIGGNSYTRQNKWRIALELQEKMANVLSEVWTEDPEVKVEFPVYRNQLDAVDSLSLLPEYLGCDLLFRMEVRVALGDAQRSYDQAFLEIVSGNSGQEG